MIARWALRCAWRRREARRQALDALWWERGAEGFW